eukprot:scaffold111843_cov32-Tisochrysis_lutea.AAC.3
MDVHHLCTNVSDGSRSQKSAYHVALSCLVVTTPQQTGKGRVEVVTRKSGRAPLAHILEKSFAVGGVYPRWSKMPFGALRAVLVATSRERQPTTLNLTVHQERRAD